MMMHGADDNACTNQSHAGDAHNHPTPLHRTPLFTDRRADYTTCVLTRRDRHHFGWLAKHLDYKMLETGILSLTA